MSTILDTIAEYTQHRIEEEKKKYLHTGYEAAGGGDI